MPRIVIDIDENMYQKIKGMETLILKNRAYKSLELAVLEGTVLPEHHGRLIDADIAYKIVKPIESSDAEWGMTAETAKKLIHDAFDRAPTIIPATETPTERG